MSRLINPSERSFYPASLLINPCERSFYPVSLLINPSDRSFYPFVKSLLLFYPVSLLINPSMRSFYLVSLLTFMLVLQLQCQCTFYRTFWFSNMFKGGFLCLFSPFSL